MNYKVGDKVRIVKRVGDSRNYPFSFIDSMAAKAGNIYEIESIEPVKNGDCKINGDFSLYHLKGDACAYDWHSSMFEPVEPKLYNLPEEESIKIVL